jgi:hypothetical protein
MNSAADIIRVLPMLTNEELGKVERALIQVYRDRKVGIVYDDAYGVLTEAHLSVIADDAFSELDRAENKRTA